jgi:hypothetical protein
MFGLVGCADKPPGQEGGSLATWRIDSAPIVSLGDSGGEFGPPFGFVQGATLVGDTMIVLGDRENHQLRLFDSEGNLIRTFGRQGEGPGEYRYLYHFQRCGDSLHVSDIHRALWNVYSTDGRYVRSYPDWSPGTGAKPTFALACNADGLFVRYPYPSTDVQEIIKVRPMVPIWLANASGDIVADLGDFPGPELLVRGWRSWDLYPLGKLTAIAIGKDRVYVGLADTSSILTYRLDGTLLSAIEPPFPPRATTEADRERYRLLDTLGQHPLIVGGALRRWESFQFPDTLPSYSALRVDAADLLWVRAFSPASGSVVRWVALTQTGTFVGDVDLPVTLEVAEIGIDYVLGIETDLMDGSQHVRAYRLYR